MTNWISVDDRLPLVNQRVLVLAVDGSQSTAFLRDRYWIERRWENGTYWMDMAPNANRNVSHWMKLPKLPKI